MNKNWDKILFFNFIRRGGVAQRAIFQAYPELRETTNFTDDTELENIVSNFVDQLYSQYQPQLEKIVAKERRVLNESGEAIFLGLEKVMGCKWEPSYKFFATPTLLPINPFWKNGFYFSVYKEVNTGKASKRRVDRIAIHELSHICWYQKLEKVYEDLDFTLNEAANYYLKEAIAAIIGESREFLRINKGFSPANKNVALLQVKVGSNEIGFVDFFRNFFAGKERTETSFDVLAKEVVLVCFSIQDKLDKKMAIWNKHGDELSRTQKEEYQIPIPIQPK